MSSDEHDWCWARIPDFQQGTLADGDLDRVKAHLETCAECGSQLEAIDPVEVPEDERPELRDRVLRSKRFIPALRPPSNVMRSVLAGAAVIFLGIVGYVIEEYDLVTETPPAADPEPTLVLSSPRDVFDRKGVPKDDAAAVPLDEQAVFFPEAQVADHNESADADYHQMKGDSKNVLSYVQGDAGGYRGRMAGRNFGARDVIAVGGGYARRPEPVTQREVLTGSTGKVYVPGKNEGAAPDFFNPTDQLRRFQQPRPQAQSVRVEKEPAPKAVERPAQEEAPRMSRKIIRSGEMEFEIDSFDSAVAVLTKITVEEQGFLATVNSEKLQNGKVRGTVVVRIPPDRLDTLLLKLRALGDLKSQRIGSEDVTKTYMDLESRLRAARTMEERLIAMIKDGKGAIKDLLAAEKELGEWRTKIETMVGEINYYGNLIAHSTLTITLSEREIRAPHGLVETERVEMGLEVEDVEKTYTAALAAVAESKGRVTRSELKQVSQGQFNAILQFEVAPDQAGLLRDRFKQLGTLARLDINRQQEAQGGSGRPQDAKVRQNDTTFLVSIYNLANVAPRETVQINLVCADAEKSYKAVLDRVEKAGGRILSSNLSREQADQTSGRIQFQVKTVDAEAVQTDVRATGEVMKYEVTETQDPANSTRTKRGFSVGFYGLGLVQPRETSTVALAAKDVAAGYRGLLDAAKAAEARVLDAQLNESDRKNMTATLIVEIRRDRETAFLEAMAKAGEVYSRSSSRTKNSETVVDAKALYQLKLFNAANIPARETVKLSVEVNDVDAASKALESDYKGRVADAKQTRDAGGRREATLTIDVPLKDAAAAIERIKALGAVLEQTSTKNAGVPDNDLAVARLEVKVANEVLVGRDSGPMANIKRGLAISMQAGSWALMLIMIGVCFVCPLMLAVWGALTLKRRFSAKPAEAPAAA